MRSKCSSQKGASAVEFALVLPLLMIILFGIIEFSVMFYDKAMITNASREGARKGIVFRADASGNRNNLSTGEIATVVDNYVKAQLTGNSLLISFSGTPVLNTKTYCSNNGITFSLCNPSPSTIAQGDFLKVVVEYTYGYLVIPNFITTIIGPAHIGAEAVMRME